MKQVELLRHCLELLKIRMGERLQFGFTVDPTLEAAPSHPCCCSRSSKTPSSTVSNPRSRVGVLMSSSPARAPAHVADRARQRLGWRACRQRWHWCWSRQPARATRRAYDGRALR